MDETKEMSASKGKKNKVASCSWGVFKNVFLKECLNT